MGLGSGITDTRAGEGALEHYHVTTLFKKCSRRSWAFCHVVPVCYMLALTCSILAPSRLSAQHVLGQVVDSTSGLPVGRGFVVLLDESGNEVARSLSSEDGRFSLIAPSGGEYRLRSERIGFGASVSEPILLTTGQQVLVRLPVTALPVRLATLIVPGRNRCSTNPEQGASTVLIWEEVRKALAATVWAEEQEMFHYRMYNYRRELDARRISRIAETGAARSGLTDPPFRSVPVEQLAREGYIVERVDGMWYYLPDAYVLMDQQFLGTHCFHVVRDEDERPGQVGLAFEPMNDRNLPDVEGTLWLDENSSELKELEVQHTRVRYNIRDRRIGGTVRFMMLPSGAWIVREWQVRTPKINVTQDSREVRGYASEVDGFADTGGEIYQVSTRNGNTVFEAPLATIVGTVFDSTAAWELPGAFVSVAGTNFRSLSDATGRFELTVPLAGEYVLTLEHPRLDSVAAPEQTETVELVRNSSTEVTFALPHLRSSLGQLCGRALRSPDSRVIFGVVRDSASGTPTSGVTVAASWQSFDLPTQPGGGILNPRAVEAAGRHAVVRELREEVTTGGSGFFAICDLPATRPVRLSAEGYGKISREASVIFPRQLGDLLLMAWDKLPGGAYDFEYAAPQPAWKIDLALGAPRQAPVAPPSSVLYGTVTDSASGEPLSGVTVIVNNGQRVVTSTDGQYQLLDVEWRQPTSQIEFRRLGFAPVVLSLQVNSPNGELLLDVSLPQPAIRMAEVVVEGERVSVPARLAGFYERREIGIGEFLTEEDWEDLPTAEVADVLSRQPGVTLAEWRVLLSRATYSCRRSGVSARVWVDGVSVSKEFIRRIDIQSVVGIEVYHRIADGPLQYSSAADRISPTAPPQSSSTCGVVLIWTR